MPFGGGFTAMGAVMAASGSHHHGNSTCVSTSSDGSVDVVKCNYWNFGRIFFLVIIGIVVVTCILALLSACICGRPARARRQQLAAQKRLASLPSSTRASPRIHHTPQVRTPLRSHQPAERTKTASEVMFSESLRHREREREEREQRSKERRAREARERNANYAARIAMRSQAQRSDSTSDRVREAREARESAWLTQWRATQRKPVPQSQSPPAYKTSGSTSAGAEREERDRVERGMQAENVRRAEQGREVNEVNEMNEMNEGREEKEVRGDWSPVVDQGDPLGDLGVREGESSRGEQRRAVGGGTVPWGENYGWSDNSEVLPKYER